MPPNVAHTARLPFGFRATFVWSAERRLRVEWHPASPSIRSARHRKRFFAAYVTERRTFMETVAATLGGAVGVIDLPAAVTDGQFVLDCVMPPTRH
jgi:hypothetical protein